MAVTISKRPSLGGDVIFASETATTIKEAISEMRSALKDGEKLDLQGANLGGGDAGQGLTPNALSLPDADPRFALSVIEAATATTSALNMDTWHTCETTHCLAGWAVHLAGVAGKALERFTSPSVAGAILAPSLAHLFYVGNEEALEALPGVKAELEAQCARGGAGK